MLAKASFVLFALIVIADKKASVFDKTKPLSYSAGKVLRCSCQCVQERVSGAFVPLGCGNYDCFNEDKLAVGETVCYPTYKRRETKDEYKKDPLLQKVTSELLQQKPAE